MSSGDLSPEQIREPRPRRLLLVAVCLLLAAAAIVFNGVRSRAKSDQEVARRTSEQAVPSVEVLMAQRGTGAQEIVLPGDIQAFSTAPIYARASGYVHSWHKDIGDKVKKGDVLAEIDTPDLDQQYAQAKADLSNSIATSTLATATAQRYHALVGRAIVSQQADEEKTSDANSKAAAVESARANLARLEALMAFKSLVAPFDGVVTARSIDVGALINAGGTTGTALYQIADLHAVRVYVRVPQAFVAELKEGLSAKLGLPQYPGQTFDAKLVGISNSVSQESRTALVQLHADNPSGKLWPGNYTEVHFQLDANPNVLRVPATALIFGEGGIRVATLDANDAVAIKPVQIGRDIGADVEVLAGITGADRLIDSPLETLDTGSKVRVVKGPGAGPKVVRAEERSRAD
jgi:RND family efflux transporter MFP subunit